MTGASAVRIALVHRRLLGTYGDVGNALVLARRLTWRGIPAETLDVEPGDAVPEGCDIYLLGGGADAAQETSAQLLRGDPALRRGLDAGAVVFAVCAGFQMLGRTFPAGGRAVPGLDLLDADTTVRLPRRAVGEITVRPAGDVLSDILTGFENHGSATVLGPSARPLGHVLTGIGNGAADQPGAEGALQGGIVATYLHGPALARNPALADLLLARAVGRDLEPIDIPEVDALRGERLAAAGASAAPTRSAASPLRRLLR